MMATGIICRHGYTLTEGCKLCLSDTDWKVSETFVVGQRVRVRADRRRPGDFDEAVVVNIDPDDHTIDVEADGKDWGQWFIQDDDGTYDIEPIEGEQA